MTVDTLFVNIAELATAPGPGPLRGGAQKDLTVIKDAALAVSDGRVAWLGPRRDWQGQCRQESDLLRRAVVPGLVDPHTHVVWAGERLGDFEARLWGQSYESILAQGGGIRSTVKHTAAASVQELVRLAAPRLSALVRSGATTIEVKSGYGFTKDAEIAMLEAVKRLQEEVPARLIPTLLVHVPPIEASRRQAYLDMMTSKLIPEVARASLATALDVFVEREAFSVDEADLLLDAARANGLEVKLHADQFHVIGGVELALRHRALSVDHLEASGKEQIAALAQGDTVATILPGVSLHLGLPPAPGRGLIDAGAAVAVATDLNPGSSPLFSTSLALALSVRLCGLRPSEALNACTANAAAALGLNDVGRLAQGCQADFLILDGDDWRELPYRLGSSAVAEVWIAGKRAKVDHDYPRQPTDA